MKIFAIPEEKRFYVIVPRQVKIPGTPNGTIHVTQPSGRMAAQACHVVSQLRHEMFVETLQANPKLLRKPLRFEPVTTIILECRNTDEMLHVWNLVHKAGFPKSVFYDSNAEAYGVGLTPPTAIAFQATKPESFGISDYLPKFLGDLK